jgi:dipicolinate synthase subunit A
MMQPLKIAVFGGDARQIFMTKALIAQGYSISVWGLGEPGRKAFESLCFRRWQEALAGADVLLLPLPSSADGVRLSLPLEQEDLSLRLSLLLQSFSGKLLLGGRLSSACKLLAEEKGIEWIDYFDSEILQLKNALPTAEGAIRLAMQELPITLDGCESAVVGYGRIGSLLAKKLHLLGSHVSVLARRQEALTMAELHHHTPILFHCADSYAGVEKLPSSCRVLFNTVPERIFTKELLQRLPQDCVLIDLASVPGGIDFSAAAELGMRAVWGTALPGRYFPETAGVFLAQTVKLILEETLQNRHL